MDSISSALNGLLASCLRDTASLNWESLRALLMAVSLLYRNQGASRLSTESSVSAPMVIAVAMARLST